MILFLLARFIMVQFYQEQTIWLTVIPLGIGMVLSPKPHIEETQSGRRYGLKSLFMQKIYFID